MYNKFLEDFLKTELNDNIMYPLQCTVAITPYLFKNPPGPVDVFLHWMALWIVFQDIQ